MPGLPLRLGINASSTPFLKDFATDAAFINSAINITYGLIENPG
jgi:hypothetical protein